jgi:hypothetical protein
MHLMGECTAKIEDNNSMRKGQKWEPNRQHKMDNSIVRSLNCLVGCQPQKIIKS